MHLPGERPQPRLVAHPLRLPSEPPAAAPPAAAPPVAALPAAATRAPARFRGAERAWGSTKEMLDGMPQTSEVSAASAAAAAAAATVATAAVAEEEERRPQRDAWNMNVDDAMAYGRRASIFSPRGAPRGAPESPLAMRTKAAANGLATPTSFATPASFRTGQPKPKVGSAEWMQTVDKARRSTQLAYADSGRSSAKRLEF